MHGLLDYLFGVLLVASPWIFGFSANRPDAAVAVVLGVVVLFNALFTNFELGVVRLFPFAIHVALDVVIAILLLGAWLHFYSVNRAGLVFVVFGVVALVITVLTRRDGETTAV